MRRKTWISAAELCLVVAVAWIFCGMPGQARLLQMLVSADDPWRKDDILNSLATHPRWRAITIVAEIESVRDPLHLISDVDPGDLITGTYVIDGNTPDSAEDPTCGKYRFSRAPGDRPARGKPPFRCRPAPC